MSMSPIHPRVIEGDVGTITSPAAVRLNIVYREIGPGPDSVEVVWEIHPPSPRDLGDLVVRLLAFARHRAANVGGES